MLELLNRRELELELDLELLLELELWLLDEWELLDERSRLLLLDVTLAAVELLLEL